MSLSDQRLSPLENQIILLCLRAAEGCDPRQVGLLPAALAAREAAAREAPPGTGRER